MKEELREEVFKLNAHNCVLFTKKEKMSELEFCGYLITEDMMLIIDILTSNNFDKQRDGFTLHTCFRALEDKIFRMEFKFPILKDPEMQGWFCKTTNLHVYIDCYNVYRMDDAELADFRNKILYMLKEKAMYIKENILLDKEK